MHFWAKTPAVSPAVRPRWSDAERALCRSIDRPTDGEPPPAVLQDAICRAAVDHRLDVALAERLRGADAWDPHLRERLAARLRASVLLDAMRARELGSVLTALDEAGVRPVIFKGAALARQVYPRPFLRPHGDTDLLIRETDVPLVHRALEARGYRRPPQVSGTLIVAQCQYVARDRAGVAHTLDLHWKPFNAPRFADVLSVDGIQAAVEPLPALGPHARAASLAHQFVLVCLHRVAHHGDGPHLLWIRDVHLLALALGDARLREVLAFAEERRVVSPCLRGLAGARACFGTPLSPAIAALIDRERAYARREGLTSYLSGERRLFDRAWRAYRDLPGWRARAVLLREQVLPSPVYMRARYGVASNAWLPALYLHRIGAGLPKWMMARTEKPRNEGRGMRTEK